MTGAEPPMKEKKKRKEEASFLFILRRALEYYMQTEVTL
jgi:hypothetical protein